MNMIHQPTTSPDLYLLYYPLTEVFHKNSRNLEQ